MNPLRKWVVYNHGEGAPNQLDFYRCSTCGRLNTWERIRKEGRCCPGAHLVGTNPTLIEAFRLLVLPWTI